MNKWTIVLLIAAVTMVVVEGAPVSEDQMDFGDLKDVIVIILVKVPDDDSAEPQTEEIKKEDFRQDDEIKDLSQEY